MKKVLLFATFLLLFSLKLLLAAGTEQPDIKQLPLDELDIKLLIDGKDLTCIRPFYRRNFPLIRLGGIRVLDGRPVGPFDVQFRVNGPGKIREGSLCTSEWGVSAEIEGPVKAVPVHKDMLTEKQMEGLFLELEDPWVYEKPVEGYFPTDSGVLMNLKREVHLTPEEEKAKMKRMDAIMEETEKMIAEQGLESKWAVELLDKEWFEAPSGFGDKVQKGRRKIVLILSQQEEEKVVEEVLFVIESPATYYEETVAWCAKKTVVDNAVRIGRKIRNINGGK